jgi:hypothetical protein
MNWFKTPKGAQLKHTNKNEIKDSCNKLEFCKISPSDSPYMTSSHAINWQLTTLELQKEVTTNSPSTPVVYA